MSNPESSKTILYYRPGACALAPHIALHWTGLEHEARVGKRDDPEFLAVSPRAVVPALVTPDGTILNQAGALLAHIARQADRPDLLGAGVAHGESIVGMWSNFFGCDFHPAFWPYFAAPRFTVSESEQARADVKAAGVLQVKQLLKRLDAHLEGRTFFVGESKTVVDAYAVPMVRWSKNITAIGLDEFPHVRAWYDNIVTDEGVKAAMAVQGIEH
ncbi:MAG: glutathione S-transferase family protein [Myxococcota bacterium]